MNKDRQRELIAEFCGIFKKNGVWLGPGCNHLPEPPDYLNDLNAIHIAEGILPSSGGRPGICDYAKHLSDVQDRIRTQGDWWTWIHSPANQRAEALLRTIGKWKTENAL